MENTGESLASYRKCLERIEGAWSQFQSLRADRLRHGGEAEKVAEAVVEDLLTGVLDWSKGDLLYQEEYADIVLSRNLCKYLVIEVKRPGTLFPGRQALHRALAQARRYADEQKIRSVAATDGRFLYAVDLDAGGIKDRLLVDLSADAPPQGLWWISIHGIYRPCDAPAIAVSLGDDDALTADSPSDERTLHPKYKLPARCFAYVGDASNPKTWKLPYLMANGRADVKRLPKAIQSLISNYRGAKVGGIPESAIKDVLLRLARAAAMEGRMPPQATTTAPVYEQLALVLNQLGLTLTTDSPAY
jgi:hypothetical protein